MSRLEALTTFTFCSHLGQQSQPLHPLRVSDNRFQDRAHLAEELRGLSVTKPQFVKQLAMLPGDWICEAVKHHCFWMRTSVVPSWFQENVQSLANREIQERERKRERDIVGYVPFIFVLLPTWNSSQFLLIIGRGTVRSLFLTP